MRRVVPPFDMEQMEKQEILWNQYSDYIETNRTTPKERRLLREWVSSGHSVYDNPGTRYLCDQDPPLDYLAAYRQDQELGRILEGKTADEKLHYLKSFMGYGEKPAEVPTVSKSAKGHIRKLEHELFFLWEYLCSEGLWDEAKTYIEEHEGEEIPFGFYE